MNEKTKLYVFEKKEVALIFLFMLLISVTSFLMGLKIGKDYSLEQAGITPEDQKRVELLSGQEEKVNEVVHEQQEVTEKDKEDINQQLQDVLKKKFEKEFTKENDKFIEEKKNPEATKGGEKPLDLEVSAPAPEKKTNKKEDQFSGKFTIQLSSHRSMADAEQFANGFKVRGYNPIINEVELSNRGTWYRVSLGVFSTVTDAKEYILKEKDLFQGYDYVITQFD